MSNIVTKLIYNTLVQNGSVALPSLGSLRIEGEPKKVIFEETVHAHMPSILSIIVSEGGVSKEEAERLYADWLAEAKEADGAIFVEGVGRISPRHMDIEPAFNRALNGANAPMPTATLEKRKKSGWVWILLIVLLLGGGAAWYFTCDCCTEECAVEETAVSRDDMLCGTPEKMLEGAACEATCAEKCEQNEKVATPPAPGLRYNVAVGVFSIKWNAQDCTRQDPLGIGTENYLIDRFPSDLWVVIAHSTDDWREAEKMRKEYKKIQRDVWVYRRY